MLYLPINYIIEFRKIFVEIFYGKKGKNEKEKEKEAINCFDGFFFFLIFYKSGIKIFLK